MPVGLSLKDITVGASKTRRLVIMCPQMVSTHLDHAAFECRQLPVYLSAQTVTLAHSGQQQEGCTYARFRSDRRHMYLCFLTVKLRLHPQRGHKISLSCRVDKAVANENAFRASLSGHKRSGLGKAS